MMVSKFVRQKLMKIMESFPDITLNNRKQLKKIQILGMSGIAILFLFGFLLRFLKKGWESVRNEFCSVRFEKTRFGSDIVVIYCLCNT